MIEVKGHEVHYYTAGQGEPLVVVHGGLGDAGTWLKNVERLATRYTVYVPDLPGFGYSQMLESEHNIGVLTEFINDFTETLGLKRFNLMGHSIGGGVALNYALRYGGKVKKLVLVDSLCLGREIALWVRAISLAAGTIGAGVIGIFKAVRWVVETLMLPFNFNAPLTQANIDLGRSIATLKEQTLILANKLSGLMMPTLVVWGARDEIVPVKQAYAAAEAIPDCRLKVFENCGHDVHRKQIGEFSQVLVGFLG